VTLALLAAVAAAVIAAVFSAQLFRQYAARRRPHALAWGLSLALFALGSVATALGLARGWSVPVFAVYWVSGALLTVPLLAVGQLLLLDPPRAVLYWTLAGLVTVWALLAIPLSTFDPGVLREASAAATIPLGEEVFDGTLAYDLLGLFNYTAIIVVVGTIWSAVRSRRFAILLIPLGVVVAGASFAFIRAGVPALFSVTLAVGVALMYAGFLAAAKPPRRPPAAPA
jgi:hypothetical protein